MTFAQIKEDILLRMRKHNIELFYHSIVVATTEQNIIDALLPELMYWYGAGVIVDSTLSEMAQVTLNSNNIYTQGSTTLASAAGTLYILGPANMIVSCTTGALYVYKHGSGDLEATATNDSFLKCICRGGTIDIKTEDTAQGQIEIADPISSVVSAKEQSVCKVSAFENAAVAVETLDDAYISYFGYCNSQGAGDGTLNIETELFNEATYITLAP